MLDTPLATPTDVENRWRPILDGEQTLVLTLIGDASALLRAEYPDLDDRVAAGSLSADVVSAVVASMVKAAMVSPGDGVSQESETVGPYSHGRQYANPLGNIFLTAAQRTLLNGRRPRAMSVRFW